MRLDIVIPAHNEERRIERTLRSYRRVLDDPDVRFLVALDQCTDRTCEIVERHAGNDDRVRLFEYPKLGKGGVIIATFGRSDADLVGFVDADCATPPRELLRLAEVAGRTGGAIATRRHAASVLPVRRPLRRRIASAGFSGGVRALMRLPYADTQCGAKVLRRDLAHAALPHLTARGLLFDVDLLLAVRDLGVELTEVPTVWVDRDGSRVDAVADSRRMGQALLALWLRRLRGEAVAAPGARAVAAGAGAGIGRDGAGWGRRSDLAGRRRVPGPLFAGAAKSRRTGAVLHA